MTGSNTRHETEAASSSDLLALLAERIGTARRASDPLAPITVLTPTHLSGLTLRRRLVRKLGALVNVNFIRPDEFAEKLDHSPTSAPPLTRLLTSEFVYRVIHESANLGPLRTVKRHPSLATALHRTFDDLRLIPDDALDSAGGTDPVAIAVIGLWREFEALTTRYADRLTVSRRAAAVVLNDPTAVRNLYGLMLVVLAERPTAQFTPLLDALKSSGLAEFLCVRTGDRNADRILVPYMSADNQAGIGTGSVAKADSTRLISAPNRAEEVRQITRNVLSLASCGTSFGEMAVLHGDSDYAPRLDEAFKAAGVPVSGSDPTPLTSLPEGRFVLGLIDVYESGFTRDAVTDWLTTAPVQNPAGTAILAVRWDDISRAAGVVAGGGNADGARQWAERLDAFKVDTQSRADRELSGGDALDSTIDARETDIREAERLQRFIESLAERAIPLSGSWSEFADWLRGMLRDYLAPNADSEPRQRIDQIMNEVSGLGAAGGPQPDKDRFVSVLVQELQQPARRGRPIGNGVFVGAVRDAVGAQFAVVHIAGMSEGVFPSRPAIDPLLSETFRDRLNTGQTMLDTRATRTSAQRREYLTALAAGDRLVLSWARSESGSARTLGPSRWALEAARIVSGNDRLQSRDLEDGDTRDGISKIHSARNGLLETPTEHLATRGEHLLQSATRWTDGGRNLADHFAADSPGPIAASLRAGRARASQSWTAWDGRLLDSGGSLRQSLKNVSPTRLETWATCPFKYFLGYVLRIEAPSRPEELLTISALDKGSMVHEILERYVLKRLAGEIDPDEPQTEMQSIAQDTYKDFERRGLTGRPLMWDLARDQIDRDLQLFIEHEARRIEDGYRPTAVELKFGMPGESRQAVDLELDDGRRIYFRGMIDRIEVTAPGGAAVVDYKTGSTSSYRGISEADLLDKGRKLQLGIYGLAVRQLINDNPSADVEATYWFVSEKEKFKRIGYALSEVEGRLGRIVGAIVSGIESGVFPANPGDPGGRPDISPTAAFENCSFCDFTSICSMNRDRLWQRKNGDEQLSTYTQLTQGEL